jgi:hypothetical protein
MTLTGKIIERGKDTAVRTKSNTVRQSMAALINEETNYAIE